MNDGNSNPVTKIFDWVYKHRLSFHPTTHILKKIEQIAANNFQCICDPNRTCPCEQSIQEVKEKGWCKCRLLCSYKAGHNYLLEYGYIDDDGNVIKKGVLDGKNYNPEKEPDNG